MKTLNIYGLAFEISTPYAEGHVLTAAEAKAMNQVRAENIGNNVRGQIDKLRSDGQFPEGAEAKAREIVAKADAEYVFNLASVGAGRKVLDPVEREARMLATDKIKAHLKTTNRSMKDVDPEKLEAKIAEIAATPEVRKIAERRVKERANVAAGLEDI